MAALGAPAKVEPPAIVGSKAFNAAVATGRHLRVNHVDSFVVVHMLTLLREPRGCA
jgi:hypothetical protein